MTAATTLAQLEAWNGDHLHTGRAHLGNCVRITLIRNHHARFQGDGVIGIIPLFSLHLILIPARFDNVQPFYFERVRHGREKILLCCDMKIACLFSGAQTDGADLLTTFGNMVTLSRSNKVKTVSRCM